MTFFQCIIAFLVLYLCVYALVSRICQCFERREIAKAYEKYLDITSKGESDNVEEKTDTE